MAPRSAALSFRDESQADRFPPGQLDRAALVNLVGRKRLRMLCENKTRFKKTEDALRFYFRLRELLHSGRARRLVADELPAAACLRASNAIDDYQCIGWCMQGLGEIDLWLLSEVLWSHLLRSASANFFARVQGWPARVPQPRISLAPGRPDPPSRDRHGEPAFARLGYDSIRANDARCSSAPPPQGQPETRPRSRRPCGESMTNGWCLSLQTDYSAASKILYL